MGILDIFKRKDKMLDLPPPPPPELLTQDTLPQDDLELPPLPDLPDLPPLENNQDVQAQKPYEIPALDDENDLALPPLEPMPRPTQRQTETNQQPMTAENKKERPGQLFIEVDEYKNILEDITIIRNKVKESDYVAEALTDLRNKVDVEFEKWREDFEEMQRKLLYMDKVLFEGNNKGVL